MHICVAVGPIIIIYIRGPVLVCSGQRVGVETMTLYYYMPFAAGVHYNIGVRVYIYTFPTGGDVSRRATPLIVVHTQYSLHTRLKCFDRHVVYVTYIIITYSTLILGGEKKTEKNVVAYT